MSVILFVDVLQRQSPEVVGKRLRLFKPQHVPAGPVGQRTTTKRTRTRPHGKPGEGLEYDSGPTLAGPRPGV